MTKLTKKEMDELFKTKTSKIAVLVGFIMSLWSIAFSVTAIVVLTKLMIMAWKWVI